MELREKLLTIITVNWKEIHFDGFNTARMNGISIPQGVN